jgi:outer membrane protein OmpA-like peptidoglycan-associated protein
MNAAIDSSHSSSASSTKTVTTRSRQWIRRDYPVLPFVWWGSLPLLGLLALLWYGLSTFAKNTIEEKVRTQTQAALEKAGHSWVKMNVSGQHVTLRGAPPAAGAGDAALAVARATTCATWTGERTCAVLVTGAFDAVAAAAPAPAIPVAPAAPAPVLQATPQLAAQRCEKSLADLLSNRKIEFATAKATLLPSSKSLLDEIAKAAKDCPGTLEVQGHTDSVGAADMNKTLSEARASSVVTALRERGLDEKRLKATGFGPDKPIADNGTPEGRAQNRRIEFRVLTN